MSVPEAEILRGAVKKLQALVALEPGRLGVILVARPPFAFGDWPWDAYAAEHGVAPGRLVVVPVCVYDAGGDLLTAYTLAEAEACLSAAELRKPARTEGMWP